jgi:hypothetical protein
MRKYLSMFVVAFAALALLCQAADARAKVRVYKKVDSRVTAVAIGAGAASAVAFFAINDWRWNDWNNSSGLTRLGAWGATTLGCAVVAPMVATAVVRRPLTMREGHVLVGSCVIPIIGGYLVNAAFDANPSWEPRRRRGR